MSETLIFDTETDNLLDKMTRLWMLQIGSADGDDCTIYLCDGVDEAEIDAARVRGLKATIRPLLEGIARLKSADRYIAHNAIQFDVHAIERFFPGTIERHKLLDSLVLARLQDPE